MLKNYAQYLRVQNRFPSILGVPLKQELYCFKINIEETKACMDEFSDDTLAYMNNYPVSFYIKRVYRLLNEPNIDSNIWDVFLLRRSWYATDSMDFSESLNGSLWVTPWCNIYNRRWMSKECERLGFKRNTMLATVSHFRHSKECYGFEYHSDEIESLPMEIVKWPAQGFIESLRETR